MEEPFITDLECLLKEITDYLFVFENSDIERELFDIFNNNCILKVYLNVY